jgi:WD40-like Beta Propeller Repeat
VLVQEAGSASSLSRLLLGALLATGAVASEPPSGAEASGPERVFQGFVDAMNRHDVDAQYSFYADDMVYVDEGRRIAPPREDERRDRAFERGSGAVWSYVIVGRGPDRLDVILTEDMEFYRALGAGPRSSRREVRFRDGKIVELSASEWTQAGRPYDGARDLFQEWLVSERPSAAAKVVRSGRLVFDASSAPILGPLAREWRAAHPCRLYHPSFHPREPRIVFSSDCEGKWNVYVAREDGSHPLRLTDNTADARRPSWSPDGGRVLFQSDRDGNWEIYSVAAGGGGLARLTHDPAADTNAAYSPDGTRILWSSRRAGSSELYIMAADGSSTRRLTSGTTQGFAPAWSPDGTLILYPASRQPVAADGDPIEVYRLRPDGQPLGVLPGGPRREYNHAFSPDGGRIAFDAHAQGAWESADGQWELWSMNADGSARQRLTHNQVNEWGPAFSPDGRRLVFLCGRDNVYDLYRMNLDGSDRRRLTRWTANPD